MRQSAFFIISPGYHKALSMNTEEPQFYRSLKSRFRKKAVKLVTNQYLKNQIKTQCISSSTSNHFIREDFANNLMSFNVINEKMESFIQFARLLNIMNIVLRYYLGLQHDIYNFPLWIICGRGNTSRGLDIIIAVFLELYRRSCTAILQNCIGFLKFS